MTMANPMTSRAAPTSVSTWPVDPVVTIATVALLAVGLVMVASASSEISARTYDNPLFMFAKHGVYMAIAIGVALSALLVPINVWNRTGLLLLLVSFALLAAVLVPGVGKEVNGSTRWISFGAFSLQGSEFVKLFVLVYVAGYLAANKEEITNSFKGFLKPLALVLALVALLLQQPDFGAAVVILAAVMGVTFLAGVPMKFFFPIMGVGVAGTAFVAILQPYRLERLAAFTNPWEHRFEGGYQLTQALIAFGRGEWFGLGLGNSIQKLFFLPEAHTDFLFSIVAEELGVIGVFVIISLFVVLVARAMWIGRMAENRGLDFHAYLAFGIALMLGIQAAINMGVNVGLLPTKGLTLPLVSYGGNSLIVSCLFIALLLRIEHECRYLGFAGPRGGVRKKRGGRS